MFAKIGRNTPASVGTNPLRADNLGNLIVSGGEYKDVTLAGKHYFAFCADMEVALYTATAAIGLIVYNPPTSGVNLMWYKWSAQVWATSATMTGMVLAITAQGPALAAAGLAAATLTGRTLLTGSTGLVAGAAAAYSTGTLLVAPVIAWPLFHNTAAINIVGSEITSGDLQGAFGSAPGTATVFGALGAAGVNVNLGLTWEEVPIGL
jgi:hypothetical protein